MNNIIKQMLQSDYARVPRPLADPGSARPNTDCLATSMASVQKEAQPNLDCCCSKMR